MDHVEQINIEFEHGYEEEELGTVMFISGVYGVGKSTLCNLVSEKCGYPFYSAGDLISSENGEMYGANKVVKSKEKNQSLLVKIVSRKLKNEALILLAGHFCILGKQGNVELLPKTVYKKLGISSIVLLESDSEIIIRNLKERDGIRYTQKQIEKFIYTERICATTIAEELQIPLYIHNVKFDDKDMEKIIVFMKEVYGESVIGY